MEPDFLLRKMSIENILQNAGIPVWNASELNGTAIGDLSTAATNQVLLYNAGEWVPGTVSGLVPSAVQQNVLYVSPVPTTGQYATITEAVAAVLPGTATYIIVGPGLYIEDAISVPLGVHITGSNPYATVVMTPDANAPIFTVADQVRLYNMTLVSGALGPEPLLRIGDANGGVFQDVFFVGSNKAIEIGPSDTLQRLSLRNVVATGIVQECLTIDGTGAGQVDVSIALSLLESTTAGTVVDVFGTNAKLFINTSQVSGNGTNTGITVRDGADSVINQMYFQNLGVAVTDGGSNSRIAGNIFEPDSTDTVIDITQASTTGYYSGEIEYNDANINQNSLFYVRGQDQFSIHVAPKGKDFPTLGAALAYIASAPLSPSDAQNYVIYINPGTYPENPLTVPSFVNIEGVGPNMVRITPLDNSAPLLTVSGQVSISGVSIQGPSDAGVNAVHFTGGIFGAPESLTLRDIVLTRAGGSLVYVSPATAIIGRATVYARQITLVPPFQWGFRYSTGVGAFIGFVMDDITMTSSIAFPDPASIIRTEGNAVLSGLVRSVNVADFSASGQVTFFRAFSGGSYTLSTMVIEGLDRGVVIENSVTTPVISISDTVISNATSLALSIMNPNTTGVVNIITPTSAISTAADNVNIFNQDPTNGNLYVGGELFQGETYDTVTNISRSILQSPSLGIIEGGLLSAGAGFVVNIAAGDGYLDSTVTGSLKHIVWDAGDVTLTANATYYIYVDENGVFQTSFSAPAKLNSITLGGARTNASTTAFFFSIADNASHETTELNRNLRSGLGTVYVNGSIVSEGATSGSVDVTSGEYIYGSNQYSPAGGAPVTLHGVFGTDTLTTPFTEFSDINASYQYDNAGTLTAIPATEFARHLLLVANDGPYEVYILVYGRETFTSQLLAEDGDDPSIPTFLRDWNTAPIASLIVPSGAATNPISSIVDIRPFVSFRAGTSGGGATVDHQALINRSSPTAHTQYLLRDGSDTMTGALNMNTNLISNAGAINGVTIQTHASRHLPGGADALLTATPVDIGNANAIGIAASFSRSDHVHAHGAQGGGALHASATTLVNGFMSAADKATLDGATATPTANAIAEYNASGELVGNGVRVNATGGATRPLVLQDADNSNGVSISAADVSASYSLVMPDAQGALGEMLVNSGAGILSWGGLPTVFTASFNAAQIAAGTNGITRVGKVGSSTENDILIRVAVFSDTVLFATVRSNITGMTRNSTTRFQIQLDTVFGAANMFDLTSFNGLGCYNFVNQSYDGSSFDVLLGSNAREIDVRIVRSNQGANTGISGAVAWMGLGFA